MKRGPLRIVLSVALIVLLAALAFPVSMTVSRLLIIVSAFAGWGALLALSWKHRALRMVLIVAPVVLTLLILLPRPSIDSGALAKAYVSELAAYKGARYVWGGENRIGVDCSGLVRSAMSTAALKLAVKTGNASCARFAFDIWWHDVTAEGIADGYEGRIRRLSLESTIASMPPDTLRPGDLAVAKGGKHVLAYIGDGIWAQAEPERGVVVVEPGTPFRSPWYTMPARLVRWNALAEVAP